MPAPLRITFALKRPGLEGGVRVIAIYAEALARLGHEVTLVSTGKAVPGKAARLRRFLKTGSLSPVYPPLPGHLDPLPQLTGLPGPPIRRVHLPTAGPILEKHLPNADVLIATWWETAEWIANLPASKGAKAYLIQHDERVFEGVTDEQKKRIQATWHLPMTRVAVAQWLADLLEKHGVAPTHVIENAVDHKRFHAPPRNPQTTPTVGFMYSPVAFKGADLMKAAVELAQQRLPNLHAIAFGHVDPEKSGPGLPPQTTYTTNPAQDQLRHLYASCDAWLFASRCEGFGLPLLEAMACRTPVIAVPTGAAPQLVTPDNGRPVPMNDPKAMADAIVDLTGLSAEDWQKTSENAHAHARTYRWEHATTRFADVLTQAAAQPAGATGQGCR